MAEAPSWEATYKKFKDEGFHIVGLEGQSSPADAAEFAKLKNMTFQITSGGNLKGSNVSAIPHCFLFGADGNLVSDKLRSGPELEKKIKEQIKETAAAMAGPGPYVKLAPLAAQVKSGVGLGSVLKTLATKKGSKDPAEVAEATMMYDALHNAGEDQIKNSEGMKAGDPLTALTRFDRIAQQFSGDEIGKKAADESAAMKKDPKIRKELEAAVVWKTVTAMNDKLKPVKGVKDPADKVFRKINLDQIQVMLSGCQMLVQKYPDTLVAGKAKEMIDSYVKNADAAK